MLDSINRNQWKLIGLVGAVLLVIGGAVLLGTDKKPDKGGFDLALTVWGVGLTSAEVQPVLDRFTDAYASRYGNKLSVTFQTWPLDEYEDVLVNKIAEGKGPDVAFVKNTWMLKHYTKLVPLPENFTGYIPRVSERDSGIWDTGTYERVFVKTVPKDFIVSKKIYAFPLFVDSIGLYYNEDHFRQAGVTGSRPAATWDQVALQVPDLVRRGFSGGALRRAAIALGTVGNIRLHVQRADTSAPTLADNGADLVSLFLLQHGGAYCADDCTTASFNRAGRPALELFTRFARAGDDAYTWSPTFTQELGQQYVDDDVDAFLSGTVSAVLGYSDLLSEIQTRSTGGSFPVKVAPVPQVVNRDGEVERRLSLASYWGVAVTKNARTKFVEKAVNDAQTFAAFELVAYMGRYEQQLSIFQATKRPPAREDLVKLAADAEPALAAIIRQAQIAESPMIYDEEQLKEAITAAFAQNPGADAIERAISEAVRKMTQSTGRTPVPPKPSTPPGVR